MLHARPAVRYVMEMARSALLLFVVVACGYPKAGPPPGRLALTAVEAARVRFPAVTAESLEAGRQTFVHRCNGCHKHPALGAYSDPEWQAIVPRMGGKAKLSSVESEQVLQFVLAARIDQRSL